MPVSIIQLPEITVAATQIAALVHVYEEKLGRRMAIHGESGWAPGIGSKRTLVHGERLAAARAG